MISGFRNDAGFSLIELSIIMVIVGLMGATALETYRGWLNGKINGDTEAHKNLVTDALTFFVANYSRLPCPAAPGLPPSDPLAGQENCLTVNGPVGECANGLCRIAGRRDANSTETTPDANGTNDPVLLGTIPYASLGLSVTDGLDGWRNKITYAVSEYVTRTETYNDQYGVINLTEATRDPNTGIMPPPTNKGNTEFLAGSTIPGTFLYVALSHGADGKGAWNYEGIQAIPCAGAGYDLESCDGDETFVNADPATGIFNKVPGATFFDDPFSSFRVNRDNDKWTYSTTTAVRNKTGGRVGIGVLDPGIVGGVPDPLLKLDVGGNILAEDYRAMEYCSEATGVKPSYCFESTMVGGTSATAAQCGTTAKPMLMRGVDGANSKKLDCANVISTTSITPFSCPAGPPAQYIKGIDATGAIICQAP